MNAPLPAFLRPPVVEVAISLQFKPLDSLRTSHFGLFWAMLRRYGFSRAEEYPPLPAQHEQFAAINRLELSFKIETRPPDSPPLRSWFLNSERDELIQLQRDRLIVNWRKGSGTAPYPRYSYIIERFKFALDRFQEFLGAEGIGPIFPDQCEITYVNLIPLEQSWSQAGDLGQILTLWGGETSDDFLPRPEAVESHVQFRMNDSSGKPLGRLHLYLQHLIQPSDAKPIYMLALTARGTPEPSDFSGMQKLFDLEHEWIVRGFASVTTRQMHEFWGRSDGH